MKGNRPGTVFTIMKRITSTVFSIALLAGCGHSADHAVDDAIKIVSASDLKWTLLNPARGADSPRAATLWGDRQAQVATGFLVKFVDGFSSPPHIHNVSYKGIVISGLVHNDDPRAAQLWMPKSSYWTQPAGEVHITSARGEPNLAFIEIDSGPYLVQPARDAFDNGERPFNIHADNILWQDQGKVKIARLWQDKAGQVTGFMLKFSGRVRLAAEAAHLVLIAGELKVRGRNLSPGSAINISRKAKVELACAGEEICILYLKSDKAFRIF